MIGYATIGVSDMDAAKEFYTALFEPYGGKIAMDLGRIAFIGNGKGKPMLAICTPFDGNAPTAGNGNMIAYPAGSKAEIDALYAKAIALGATCDGKPGQRIPDRFYGAYVRDPDGNKLCFFEFG